MGPDGRRLRSRLSKITLVESTDMHVKVALGEGSFGGPVRIEIRKSIDDFKIHSEPDAHGREQGVRIDLQGASRADLEYATEFSTLLSQGIEVARNLAALIGPGGLEIMEAPGDPMDVRFSIIWGEADYMLATYVLLKGGSPYYRRGRTAEEMAEITSHNPDSAAVDLDGLRRLALDLAGVPIQHASEGVE